MNTRTFLPLVFLFMCMFPALSSQAQYSFDALRLSLQMPGQDPHSMSLGSSSAARSQGFGSWMVNPAVAGRMASSSFSAGIGIREVEQRSTFIGQQTTFDDNQTGITHIGFSYKVPTVVGSLVFGGGYAQAADYNSAFTINAFNDFTSRSYQFLTDYTSDIAFNTFAIDEIQGELRSVFDFGDFYGVQQYGEMIRRGHSGEYGLFLATEFQKNMFIGVAAGVPVSNSRFQQLFIETAPGDQAGRPLYSGDRGTGTFNIDRLLFEEKLRVSAIGINARLGMLYTGMPLVDLGASYTTSTRWSIEEKFDAFIQTRFRDVVTLDGDVITDGSGETFGPVLSDRFEGEYSYAATTPSRIHLGMATKDIPVVDLSVSAERIGYSGIRLRNFDSADRETEISENNFINENFADVWNLRAGVSFRVMETMEPRLGWAWMDNPVKYLENNQRQFISAGLGIGMNQRMVLDFAVQYGFWKTTEDLYYVDASTGIIVDQVTGAPVTFFETANQKVDRFHAVLGIQVRL